MMPLHRYLWLLLAAGHLATVGAGACHLLPDWSSGPPAQVVRWYATMSGAGTGYGFFAPVVGAEHRARFRLQDDQGRTWWDVFDETSSPEARLRLTGIVDLPFMSGRAGEFPEWRQRLVKSWAAAMFNRHPRAVSLEVSVEFYDIPTIAEYRAGSRPSWEVAYRARVQRDSPAGRIKVDP